MSIFIGSRYETATIDYVTDTNGDVNRVAFRGVSSTLPDNPLISTTYTVHNGDRIDRIARMFYGREDVWWLIADANKDVVGLSDPITPGTILRIPDARYLR